MKRTLFILTILSSLFVNAQVYVIDNQEVYYYDQVIKDADPDSFEVISKNTFFTQDKNLIFYKGEKTTYDRTTFEIKNDTYIVDKNDVYYLDDTSIYQKLGSHSPMTFEQINDKIAIDKEQIYFDFKALHNSDGSSFELLSDTYSIKVYRDKNQVYINDKTIPLSTSKLKIFRNVRNEINYLGNNTRICDINGDCFEANIDAFKILSHSYIKDDKTIRLRFRNSILYNADVSSFKVPYPKKLPDYARDKTSDYYSHHAFPERIPKLYLKNRESLHNYYDYIEETLTDAFISKPTQSIFKEKIGPSEVIYSFPSSGNTKIRKGKEVYMNTELQYFIDASSFKIFNDDYAKDKNYVYLIYEEENSVSFNPIEGIDPKTFEIIPEDDKTKAYCKDANAVYEGFIKIEGADPESFKLTGKNTAVDKNYIYIKNQKVIGVKRIKETTLKELGGGYYSYGTILFYKDYNIETLIENGRIDKFEILTDHYALHNKKLMYKGVEIVNVLENEHFFKQQKENDFFDDFLDDLEIASNRLFFTKYTEKMSSKEALESNYKGIYIHHNQLYFGTHCIAKNISEIDYLGDTEYCIINGKNIYLGTKKLEGVFAKDSIATTYEDYEFILLKNNKAIYDGHVFDVDTKTFIDLSDTDLSERYISPDSYAKDKNHVYYEDKKIEGVDPESFIIYDYRYTADKNNVYLLNKKIEGADPASFSILRKFGQQILYTKDKNHVYYFGEKIEGADPESFIICNYTYAVDKNNVYAFNKKIEGADPASFYTFDEFGFDNEYFYYNLKKIKRNILNFKN